MAASLLFLLLLLPLAPAPVVSSVQQDLTTSHRNDGQEVGSPAADGLSPFIFDLAVGTSPQPLSVVMDITSDLVWVQCERCPSCTRLTPPTTPTFLTRNSSSYALVGCDTQICDYMLPILGEHHCAVEDDNLCGYIKPYYTGTTSGFLATETFSFGATTVKGVVFGCSGDITVPNLDGASGFAGFSRGPLSPVSQLNISSFTYFISPPGDPAGGKNASARTRGHLSWSWGAGADYTALQTATTTGGGGGSSSTLLLPAKEHQNPYLYYVNLTGVQVDGQLLTAIPAGTFDVRPNGSGGVYLSTTLPFTYLDKAAYNVLRPELVGRIQSQGVFPVNAAAGGSLDDRVCFLTQNLAKAKVPRLSLLFDGTDAAMELKVENYFFAHDGGQTCLTILPSAATGSVLGSLLQAGRKMTYDIYGNGGGRLTFETAAAGAPVPEWAALMIMATLMWMLGSQTLF